MAAINICTQPDCAEKIKAKGLCRKHYHAALYVAHRDEINARNARWAAANPGNVSVRSKKYRAAHPERTKASTTTWRAANSEKVKATYIKWYEANPDKRKAKNARWRQAHPEENKRRSAAWRAANPEKAKAGNGRWKTANPEAAKALDAKRRALKRGALNVPFTTRQLADKLIAYDERCWICNKPMAGIVHWDHVQPLSKGGSHSLENLQPACPLCNIRKKDKWFGPEWARDLAGHPEVLTQGHLYGAIDTSFC